MRGPAVLSIVLLGAALLAGRTHQPTPYRFPRPFGFPAMPVRAGAPVTEEGALLGRYLFYDPVLSADSTMACASCHRQEYAFSDGPKRFSAGRNGMRTARNTMPLFNLAWYPAFFWDGRAAGIEEQVSHPLRSPDEMHVEWAVAAQRLHRNDRYAMMFQAAFGTADIDSARITSAIGQFLRTLISYRSKYDRAIAGEVAFTEEEYAGFKLMNDQTKGDCLHCHTTDAGVLGTTLRFSNNGLDPVMDPEAYVDKGRGAVTGKVTDAGRFMIPSLRNVAFTAPYMHDGRFSTLEEVLAFYSTGVHPCANIDPKMEFADRHGAGLSKEEQRSIIAFLRTFSDTAFVTDPAFSDPFKQPVK